MNKNKIHKVNGKKPSARVEEVRPPSPVRTLADMTTEEKKALETKYKCKIKGGK